MDTTPLTTLTPIDYLIMAVYFAAVLGVGWMLRRRMTTSGEFLIAGRSLPAWVTGLAFISANLGAQEVIGMGASGAKYGIATNHFYWVGAIPAMVFVGIFMMPFYYGSRARSVPEYLRLRFDEKTCCFPPGESHFVPPKRRASSTYGFGGNDEAMPRCPSGRADHVSRCRAVG